ncbi:UNVERIFIED_CONTAM: hypothetical protein FKN15_016914 [Acipenser sinensis]
MVMRPFFGIQPALMDDKGNRLSANDVSGALCIAQPWPGMARTIYNDHKRYIETYFQPYPGHFFTGDGAYRSKEGYAGSLGGELRFCAALQVCNGIGWFQVLSPALPVRFL